MADTKSKPEFSFAHADTLSLEERKVYAIVYIAYYLERIAGRLEQIAKSKDGNA